ncbi:MAG: FAD-binding oxidoreductase [Pseudomonadota bacterium]
MTSLVEKLQSLGIDAASDTAAMSADLFPLEEAPRADALVRPATREDAGRAVKAAYDAGAPIIARGGGMSYTGGYRPTAASTLLFDMGALNQVCSIDEANRIAIVEAGSTWEALSQALEGTGLRAALKGPISGSHSTVGGAVSQNLPGSMDGVLGLEIIRADGTRVWTGSYGADGHTAFYRNYGPDLTGLFLGDAGTLGLKTQIALRLEPKPEGAAFASFGFGSMGQAASAMLTLAQANLGGRVFALDPLKNKTATKVGMKEGADTLAAVVKEGGLIKGLKNAAKIAAAGQGAYDDVPWSMHLTFEGASQAAANAALEKAKTLLKGAHEIPPSIPTAMYAKSYSIRGFLGLKGERWVPLHSIFPLSEAARAVAAIEALFEEHKAMLARHEIVHSFMMSANGPYFLIEPMFYWPDARLPVHEKALDAPRLAKLTDFEDNPSARAAVLDMRVKLRDLAFSNGAVACQLGRFYPYRSALTPETRALFDTLKAALDPKGLFNPGALDT